ncbi:lycopene cyclase family protein [Actinosynnema pretiosum]|uniref:Lycopene cyclase n=1 Tax=Actinosynnema pretiosum TaxID=42197 RepID=A0A290ZB51_9PSEU|nr:lycopene cyclase family protein [Actinosynnema pretiosum]ATE56226.1 lycopene cyclase [Actinosynnema pretiosum]
MDVLVVGGGPAGRALAGAAARRGLGVALVDPRPERPWRATYAAWSDELPEGTPVVTRSRARAFSTAEHVLEREYSVLDNARLWELPPEVEVLRARVVARAEGRVRLADGRVLRARRVVDATGSRGGRAAQTAVGVVVGQAEAEPFVAPGEAVIMDWRRPPSATTGDPTFLYAVPLGPDRVLLEETSLARAPGLPLAELRLRLRSRLDAHGVRMPSAEERVRIPLDAPKAEDGFGAGGGLVHPATGYGVATALRLAPVVADALAAGEGPEVLWTQETRMVHALRLRGLTALLSLAPREIPEFFHRFFQLPVENQREYLSHRDDLRGLTSTMLILFRSSPWRVRASLAGSVFFGQSLLNSG